MAYPYLSDLVRDLTGLELPLPLPMFGLLVATSLLIGIAVFGRELARISRERALPKPPEDLTGSFSMTVIFAGIIGARLFHIFEYWDDFLVDPMALIFARGGFTIFGALVFAVGAALIFLKIRRQPIGLTFDALAPTMMLGYAIGRIGCQLSGDGDWGIPANMAAKPEWLPLWLWSQTYDNNVVGILIPPPGVYPTPIYETLLSLMAFAVIWRLRRHSHADGWLFAVFLVLCGIERLLIEQIRVNVHLTIGGLEVTQAELISVGLIVAGIVGLIKLHRPRSALSSSAAAR